MTTNFAAAMRRAALCTRAYDPIAATRIIKDALAQTGFQQSASDSKCPPSLRLIDPGAEIIPPGRTQLEPRQGIPLATSCKYSRTANHASMLSTPYEKG